MYQMKEILFDTFFFILNLQDELQLDKNKYNH